MRAGHPRPQMYWVADGAPKTSIDVCARRGDGPGGCDRFFSMEGMEVLVPGRIVGAVWLHRLSRGKIAALATGHKHRVIAAEVGSGTRNIPGGLDFV
jgi:hypothetical protein